MVEFAVIERIFGQKRRQGIQEPENIVQGRGLKFAWTTEVFGKNGQGVLRGLARGTQLVNPMPMVKGVDGRDVAVVFGVIDVAPLAQLAQGRLHFGERRGSRIHSRQGDMISAGRMARAKRACLATRTSSTAR